MRDWGILYGKGRYGEEEGGQGIEVSPVERGARTGGSEEGSMHGYIISFLPIAVHAEIITLPRCDAVRTLTCQCPKTLLSIELKSDLNLRSSLVLAVILVRWRMLNSQVE